MCPKNLNFFATDIVTFSTLISALLFGIFHVHLIIFASLRIVSRIVSAHWERRLFGGNSLELGSLATLQEPHRWSAHVKHQCYRCCDSSNSSIISSFQFISSIVPSVCLQSLVIVCMMPMCYFNNWKHPELMTCFTDNQKRFPTLGLARILPACRDAMLWKAMLP
jgi:hypothetical protein